MTTIGVPQKAWMAGVLETRGKIRFTNDEARKTNQLVLQLRTSHIELVERLCVWTGTTIGNFSAKTIRVADRRPCIEHCAEAHTHQIAELPEFAVWSISGTGAAIILANLVPYFVTTAGLNAVSDNILSDLPQNGRGRHAVDMVIIRLKTLGWHIPPKALEHFVGIPPVRNTKGRFVAARPTMVAK